MGRKVKHVNNCYKEVQNNIRNLTTREIDNEEDLLLLAEKQKKIKAIFINYSLFASKKVFQIIKKETNYKYGELFYDEFIKEYESIKKIIGMIKQQKV